MDVDDPSKVLGRTTDPIMVPTEAYELSGFLAMSSLPIGILSAVMN
jgi:predicted GH43/DUF377 family glycosyl hydrolase